MKLGEDGRNLS